MMIQINFLGAKMKLPALNDSVAKLLLRLMIGGMMIFHGWAKITGGIGFIKSMFAAKGIPSFVAYGVYLGEFISPILILIGFYTRLNAIVVAGTAGVIIFTAHGGDIFSLGAHGAWAIELPMFYLLGSLAIFFLGAGKYSIDKGDHR